MRNMNCAKNHKYQSINLLGITDSPARVLLLDKNCTLSDINSNGKPYDILSFLNDGGRRICKYV